MRPELSSAKATPAVAFCFFLNRLLEREAWARERLAPFAGHSAEIAAPLLPPLRVTVAAGGRIEAGGDEVHVVMSLQGIRGSGPFAEEVRALARELRWDFEEELSRIVGDVAAARIGATARALARWPADAAGRFAEALGAYATDEAGMLVQRPESRNFDEEIERLNERLAALERRIARLA